MSKRQTVIRIIIIGLLAASIFGNISLMNSLNQARDGFCYDGEVWVSFDANVWDADNGIDQVVVIGAHTHFITNYAQYNTYYIVNMIRDGLRRKKE